MHMFELAYPPGRRHQQGRIGPTRTAGGVASVAGLTRSRLVELQAGFGNSAVCQLMGTARLPVQRSLTTANLAGADAAATAAFEAVIRDDPLYQLTETAPSRFGIVVRGEPNAQNRGELGDTTIRYQRTGEVIYSTEVDRVAELTSQRVSQDGLVVVITLNTYQARPVGAVLQVLTHEYGGHLEPFAGYLRDLVSGVQPVRMVDELRPWRSLSGGRHHADLALGRSAGYNRLRARIEQAVGGPQGSAEVLGAFYDREEEDRVSQLNKTLLAVLFGAASSAQHDTGMDRETAAAMLGEVAEVRDQQRYRVSNLDRARTGAALRPRTGTPPGPGANLPAVEPPFVPTMADPIPPEWGPH
jgi:hypothetical protein